MYGVARGFAHASILGQVQQVSVRAPSDTIFPPE